VVGVDQNQSPIVLQTIQPMDQRQIKSTNTVPEQQASKGTAAGASIVLASFLAYLYRLPLLELLTRLKG